MWYWINLKKIIPVVAEEYEINEEVKVAPKGIEELCLQTLDCIDEAKKINQDNRDRLLLDICCLVYFFIWCIVFHCSKILYSNPFVSIHLRGQVLDS